jgi:murein DD-endopeptidase MepM/ murein hydrolase activator NlpD
MKAWRRAVTIIVQPDGALRGATYRVPLLAFRALLVALVVLAVLVVLGIAFYGPIAREAVRVQGLEHEIERLRTDNAKVRELAAALDSVEANYAKLRGLVGADLAPDPVARAAALPVAPPIRVVPPGDRIRYEAGASIPRHWPLDEKGYLTRGQVAVDSNDGSHPGIDIAVPVGAIVRAAGGGSVVQAGRDPAYGLFVLVAHPSGYQTMYGHLSRAIVVEGAEVQAGAALGRSGNTGRSSAPHLHLEVRHNGVSIDPLTLIREGR